MGFVPAIYVKKDLLLAVGYFVASTMGVFAGGYLALWYFPQLDKPGILFGGIFVFRFFRIWGARKLHVASLSDLL